MFRISVSLADFYYWRRKFNISSQLEYLKIIKKLGINGVELHFSEKEILSGDYLKFKNKLKNLYVTFHLPKYKESALFYENLKTIKKLLKVNYFIIHADDFVFKKNFLKELPLLIENSDKNKPNFKNTKELLKFKQSFCFDINHSEENFIKIKKVKDQYDIIKKRVKEFHISTVDNPVYKKYNYLTTHKLLSGTNKEIPIFLKKDALFVIEGLIPVDRLDLLKKEIKLLKNFSQK
jgi:hypothetical protein